MFPLLPFVVVVAEFRSALLLLVVFGLGEVIVVIDLVLVKSTFEGIFDLGETNSDRVGCEVIALLVASSDGDAIADLNGPTWDG